jgi:hypothetical protein
MTAHLNQALTRDERQRFDAALRRHADGARPAPPPQDETLLTPYEEQVWLAQQQAPEAVLKQVVAFSLTGAVDVARLTGAVAEVVRVRPDLNARYRFGADGELHKRVAGSRGNVLRVIRARSRDKAIDLVLARQGRGWDGESEPPFEALVLLAPRETVLALVLHRVVEGAHSAADVLGAVADAYGGRPLSPARAVSRGTGVPGFDGASAMLPAWMLRGAASAITQYGPSGGAATPLSRAAGRCAAPLGPDLAGHGSSDDEVFAHLAALAARFLSALSGSRAVDLRIWHPRGVRIGDPSPVAANSDLRAITLDGEVPQESVLRAILAGLDGAEASDEIPSRQPTVWVSWSGDAARILRIEGVAVERLPLPTLEARPDLSFTFGRDGGGGLTVELVTGQAVSPHIGPVLLERFLAWITDGERALPGRGTEAPAPQAAPETPSVDGVTALILAEFRAALNAPQMRAEDDFFDHGGHSLIATRILGRLLSHHGIELRFDDLFSYPSAAELARRARRPALMAPPAAAVAERGEAGEGVASAPLALAQASLWKAYAAFGFNRIFNLPFALDFLDRVDEALFEQAFGDVIERHPALRSLFRDEGGVVRQHVVPMADLPRYKWFWTSRDSAGVERRDEASHVFALAEELPFRLRFLTDPGTGRQVLSFLFHHIALDEWSVNLMMDELVTSYRARAAGAAPRWSGTPAPFHAFARTQHAAGVDPAHVAYWTDRLRGAPAARPILTRSEGAAPAPGADSAAGGWVEFKLDRRTSEGLYALAKQTGASLFNVVYAGIVGALARLGGLSELVVGTSASGRSDAAYFDTVGYFTTVVAHRIRFGADMSVGDLVGRVKSTINESMPYTGIPIDIVEEALGMTPGRDHLFEVFIQIHAKNKLNGALAHPDGRSIAFRQVDPERHESLLGLQFEVMEETIAGERSIRVMMNYRSAHYGPAEVERITATTHRLFVLMAEEGAQVPLDRLAQTP